jgi:hypothetical protein
MPSLEHLVQSEPIFQWCFRAQFAGISGKYIASAMLPKDAVNVVLVHYRNYDKAIAGKAIHQQLNFVIKGYVEPNTAAEVWGWWKKVYRNPEVNAPSTYKIGGSMELTDGRGGMVTRWELEGCWPSQVDIGEGNYGTPDLVLITATIEVDVIKLDQTISTASYV